MNGGPTPERWDWEAFSKRKPDRTIENYSIMELTQMLNIFILKNIRDYLLENPGTFKWNERAVLWSIEIIDLYEHLAFLRKNEFTRNEQGRVFWDHGDMTDVRAALSRDGVAIESTTPSPKLKKKAYRLRHAKTADYIDRKLLQEIQALAFVSADICQIQNKLSKDYHPKLIHRAAITAGATVFTCRKTKKTLYFKFNSEPSKVSRECFWLWLEVENAKTQGANPDIPRLAKLGQSESLKSTSIESWRRLMNGRKKRVTFNPQENLISLWASMNHLDLFSGIGGFALAVRSLPPIITTQFVEIDPFCQKVIAKNFPHIPCHGDITTFTANTGDFDLITAGFPCQDVSTAGAKAGLVVGNRSGLFHEVIRIIRLVRPKFVLLENVPGLLHRGMDTVLGELSEIGYSAEWQTISCAEIGGTHRRDRVWIIAYPSGLGLELGEWKSCDSENWNAATSEQVRQHIKTGTSSVVQSSATHSNSVQCLQRKRLSTRSKWAHHPDIDRSGGDSNASDPHRSRLERRKRCPRLKGTIGEFERSDRLPGQGQEVEPSFRRNDDGLSAGLDRHLLKLEDLPTALPIAAIESKVPNHKDRLKALGNSIVPQVAMIPLKRILDLNELSNQRSIEALLKDSQTHHPTPSACQRPDVSPLGCLAATPHRSESHPSTWRDSTGGSLNNYSGLFRPSLRDDRSPPALWNQAWNFGELGAYDKTWHFDSRLQGFHSHYDRTYSIVALMI
jgi:DNA (cytosine-5)-methyltransferase 1